MFIINLGKEKSVVYEDAHDGYDYNKGRYSYNIQFNFKGKGINNSATQRRKFETQYQTLKINLFGLPFKIKQLKLIMKL
jgi:alpha-glucosidase